MLTRSLAITAFWFCLMVMTASVQSAETGTLTGRFVVDGDPPLGRRIRISGSAFDNPNVVDESLIVGSGGVLANVVIYLRKPNVTAPVPDTLPGKVRMEIKDGRLKPRIVPLWFDYQSLVVKNSDSIGYNLNVQSPGDRGYNPLLPAEEQVELHFDRAHNIPVPVGCNIHSSLRGYVLPRKNPFVAVSQTDGAFKIEDLPLGEAEFQVWHERAGFLDVPQGPKGRFVYTIQAGVNDLGTIKVAADLFKRSQKQPVLTQPDCR